MVRSDVDMESSMDEDRTNEERRQRMAAFAQYTAEQDAIRAAATTTERLNGYTFTVCWNDNDCACENWEGAMSRTIRMSETAAGVDVEIATVDIWIYDRAVFQGKNIFESVDAQSQELLDLAQLALDAKGLLKRKYRVGAWQKTGRLANPSAECGHCGAPPKGQKNNRCGGCNNVMYCNRECQEAAWPAHKRACKINSYDALDKGGLLLLESLLVQPKFRGKKLGLILLDYTFQHFALKHSLAILTPGFTNARYTRHQCDEQDKWTAAQEKKNWNSQISYWQKAGFRQLGFETLFGRPSDAAHPARQLPSVDYLDYYDDEDDGREEVIRLNFRLLRQRVRPNSEEWKREHELHKSKVEAYRLALEEEEAGNELDATTMRKAYPFSSASLDALGIPLSILVGLSGAIIAMHEESLQKIYAASGTITLADGKNELCRMQTVCDICGMWGSRPNFLLS